MGREGMQREHIAEEWGVGGGHGRTVEWDPLPESVTLQPVWAGLPSWGLILDALE